MNLLAVQRIELSICSPECSPEQNDTIFDSAKAFREIARVLASGGAHIFTVPLINKEKASECWASRGSDGKVIYHHAPEYHGNPVDVSGSLVTMRYVYDLAEFIINEAKMPTTIVVIDSLDNTNATS